MQRSWDVVVIGAGVAGGLAAYDCARRGLTVLLVEKRSFPRWKVCGCCFNANALAALTAVGLPDLIGDQGGVALDQVRLGWNGSSLNLGLPGGLALSRESFDQALVHAAEAAGATLRFQTSAVLEQTSAGERVVRLRPSGGAPAERVRARVVLVAAGLQHQVLASSDDSRPRIAERSRVGAGCLINDDDDVYASGAIHMAIGRHGYVGLVRREDGALNLAAAFDPAALRSAGGASCAADLVLRRAGFAVPRALETSRWQLTPELTRRSGVFAGERFLLLGDSSGYVEPFTGEGMAWALAAGAAVAPFVEEAQGAWSGALERRWQQKLEELTVSRQRLCRLLSTLLRQPLATAAVFRLACHWPEIPERVISALNRDVSHTACPDPCL
ncbi:putative oxidoreductase [Synechococcus sp. MIT S9509]|uniref:NAD(P)/FAD-dependent oxidoreductase n=1 Tax=unclassified Synechococcus TaxID=2626047 RepID=UPI0007BC53BC|nr:MULTISPECIES: FAD-dependent oxidoreductase [unclassified Synechococcus]KZR85344.1 putative oxidoreductase [Synechococcus sp. MIT S9504]KZR91495.1 putative oxidoreductase [Synechococcus sp. MIT S9509]